MNPVVMIIAPGDMGSAVGRRLVDNGLKVMTAVDGRSDASRKRAREAGMTAATEADVAAADIVLSIVPPGEALALAERFAPLLARQSAKPLYVDCNAVNPETARRIGAF